MRIQTIIIISAMLLIGFVGYFYTTKQSLPSLFSCGGCMTTHKREQTASGLQYTVLSDKDCASDAQKPAKGQMVHVHYTGWLTDEQGNPDTNKKFDSSYDRKDPFVFPIGVGMVIRGWDEGVMDMRVGEKRRLFIPSSLGYGAQGAGAVIPPHANLVFDVKLLKIG